MKYRKKPVVIEAEQWMGWNKDGLFMTAHPLATGNNPFGVVKRLPWYKFFAVGMALGAYPGTHGRSPGRLGWVETLEGGHIALPEDYIIRGVHGEYYPCKPDIFEKTYEAEDKTLCEGCKDGVDCSGCKRFSRYCKKCTNGG